MDHTHESARSYREKSEKSENRENRDNRENDALLAEVFAEVPAAIIVIDARGIVRKANQSALHMLGEETLEGRRWFEIIKAVFRPRPDDGSEISTRDGKRLSVQTRPLSHGQLVQITDLTETRALQDKLSHMERLSSLGRMAASLAHQIRTPLAAAILYGANLANPKLPAGARQTFQQKLMSRLNALEAQVSDILMYARSGEQTVSRLDVAGLVAQVAAGAAPLVSQRGAGLEVEGSREGLTVLGNSTALSGALSNLVNNAVEAGASQVKIRLEADTQNVTVHVANNGPAITPEQQHKIFEPFFTTKSNGTGLGLAVVLAVAKVHGGRVKLSSQEGYPVVFSLSLPRYTSDKEPSANGMEVAQPAA